MQPTESRIISRFWSNVAPMACSTWNTEDLPKRVTTGTPVVTLFGKSSVFHVEQAIDATLDQNLDMIRDSVGCMVANDRVVIYDAEHFFDGYTLDSEYALATLEA